MNLFRFATVTTAAAALLVGLSLGTAQAQTGLFSQLPFETNISPYDLKGFNPSAGSNIYTSVPGVTSGAYPAGMILALDAIGGFNEAFGVISANAEYIILEGDASGNSTEVAGVGTLVITSGDLVSFTGDASLWAATTIPGELPSGASFTFTATSGTPAVVGGTTVIPGIVIGGKLSNFGGTDGAVTINYTPVPEPGVVSLLAGFAVAGTGFGLRRRRRAA